MGLLCMIKRVCLYTICFRKKVLLPCLQVQGKVMVA